MTPLKPKPWWLRLVTPKDMWVTLKPNIYHPLSVQPLECYFDEAEMRRRHEAVLAHEMVHIEQQRKFGLLRYLALYWISRRFRYEAELEAAIKELRVISHRYGFHAYTERAHTIALQLSSVRYAWAAPSYDDAFNRMVQGVLR